jgi:hypothetical protein
VIDAFNFPQETEMIADRKLPARHAAAVTPWARQIVACVVALPSEAS